MADPSTSAADRASDSQTDCIAAVIENRAKEIGIALLQKWDMRLLLVQLIETSR